jgi:glycosyltransferase involved in cell wall biosynthesis
LLSCKEIFLTPLVSIIIPTYNRFTFLGESIDSITAQTYQNWECLIIDDGSCDYTPELIQFYTERDSRIQYYKRPYEYRKGANACRNYGLSLSKGKYINWFDSDDIMHPQKTLKQVLVLENSKKMDACISKYNLCDFRMKLIRKMPLKNRDNILLDYLTEKSFFNFQTTLFRKSTLELKPDESLHKAQELEFFIRYFQQSGIEIQVLSESLVDVRLHENNITSGFNKGNHEAIKSEMIVRLKALKVVRKIGVSKNIEEALQLYRGFLLSLLCQNKFWSYFKNVINLFSVLSVQYYLWVGKAIFLGFTYMVFKRSPYRFRNILKFTS